MTRNRIQHALDTIYEKVCNLGQADLYPGLGSGPYIQHNPLFPNGLDAIVGYIKQAGRKRQPTQYREVTCGTLH